MLSDEGQMRAARVMSEASERMNQVQANLDDSLNRFILRLEEISIRFENSVDRYIFDYPGPWEMNELNLGPFTYCVDMSSD